MTNTVRPAFKSRAPTAICAAELPGDLLTASRGNEIWQAIETEFGSSCFARRNPQ